MDNTKMVLDEAFVRELCKTNYKLGVMRERLIFVTSLSVLCYAYHCYKSYKDDKIGKRVFNK